MLVMFSKSASTMLRLTNLENPRRRGLCVLLILFAVCALTARVATRYCDSRGLSENTAVHKHISPHTVHQRMAKSAPVGLPPVNRSIELQAPSSYPKVAPAGPPVPGLVFETSLYNRPPPSC